MQCMKISREVDIELPWAEHEETVFTQLLPLDGCPNAAPRFHRPDIWHAIHLGVGKSFISSSFAILQGCIPGTNVDLRFQQITKDFRDFCKAKKLTPFVRKLDKHTFNVGGPLEEPTGSWNKASLTSTLGLFLEHMTVAYKNELAELGDERTPYIVTCSISTRFCYLILGRPFCMFVFCI